MPKFEREVEIDAPVEHVWQVLTNPEFWPEWFPGVDAVTNVTSITKGGRFEFTSGDDKGRGLIVEIEPLKRLEITTQIGDDKDAHVFALKPSGGFLGLKADECKVEYTLDTLMGGGIIGKFVAGGNPIDMMRVKKAMHAFRKVAERV
ncbi:MAG: SRPBCC family protein [Anaerolineae bacterium]|nr:SRPBCC family protein [Anaerolineae bacterium]